MRDKAIAAIMEYEERSSSPFFWDARYEELRSMEDASLIEELKQAAWTDGLKAGKAAGPYI